jgi:hypothetical protein
VTSGGWAGRKRQWLKFAIVVVVGTLIVFVDPFNGFRGPLLGQLCVRLLAILLLTALATLRFLRRG